MIERTTQGKTLAGVALAAKVAQIGDCHVWSVGEDYEAVYDKGIDARFSTIRQPIASESNSLKNGRENFISPAQ